MQNVCTSQTSPKSACRSFTGPYGKAAQYTPWNSGFLELHQDGSFILELWRLYEPLPPDDGIGSGDTVTEFQSDGSRKEIKKEISNAPIHTMDESRVKYSGTFKERKARALKLSCLKNPGLNQLFIEDTAKLIGGRPTWWSTDGQFFLYYAEQYAHWKANGLRIAGGDGCLNIRPGCRKAGHGFAHSGPGDTFDALSCPHGWFEDVEDVWTPVDVQVAPSEAITLEFHASEVLATDKEVRGDEMTKESFVGGPVTFRGSSSSSGSGELRLMLPATPERLQEGALELAPDASAPSVPDREGGVMGDPDIFLMRRSARL